MSTNEMVTWDQLFSMLWIFGWLAFFLTLIWLSDRKKRHKRELNHKERLAALEKGLPMPELFDAEEKFAPLLADHMRARSLNPRWPLGVGALCVVLGIGTSVVFKLTNDPDVNTFWPFGLLGAFLGVGLFLHYALTREKRD
jgi:hypothetical protein